MCVPNAMMCSKWMTIFKDSDIGEPISHEKRVGPSSQLTYLGIEIDTVARCVRLPQEKYISLMSLLKESGRGKGNVKKGIAVSHWFPLVRSQSGQACSALPSQAY